MAKKQRKAKPRKLRLVLANEKSPAVKLEAGQKLEVIAVDMVSTVGRVKRRGAARLCGGTSTCLAVVFTDRGDPVP